MSVVFTFKHVTPLVVTQLDADPASDSRSDEAAELPPPSAS